MYFYAHTNVEEIEDQSLQDLFAEIAELRQIIIQDSALSFLQQAMQPLPPQKQIKLEKLELLPQSILRKKIKEISQTEIYKLCFDLAKIYKMGSIENMGSVALYSFFNKALLEKKKKKR